MNQLLAPTNALPFAIDDSGITRVEGEVVIAPGNPGTPGTPGTILVPASPLPGPAMLGQAGALTGGAPAWLIVVAAVVAIVGLVMLIVPVFKGIGWLIAHLFTFIGRTLGDIARAIGSLVTAVFFVPLTLGNVAIGRWSAAAHYGRAIQDEVRSLGHCAYRVVIGNPARLLLLNGLVEGIEKRVPQAMAEAPGADRPSAKVGQFDGYSIVGSLPTGGSGAKVYVAEPTPSKQAALARAGRGGVGQVVIKSFSLRDGSTMPQIVRESRALEAARKLGLILDHEMNDERFYYAMPFVPGDSLTQVTRRLHAESGLEGLGNAQMRAAVSHLSDLLEELAYYHRGGLWHKDVKPDNIIVNAGKAHLVDLGLVTPLRSAMTLTTHGTEYFRDPELVRMALRGAKVNEVDGVKFDIYGAGAVLYSVIENSFPAHGALSQIVKKCPEALRWVIRRSMAEMNQRYANADEMLGDLRAIAAAADPYALKPIELPSMGGAPVGAAAPDLEPKIEQASFVRGGPPPLTPPPVPADSAAKQPEGFVFETTFGVGQAAAAAAARTPRTPGAAQASPRTRPAIRLTDWWTGKYRVEGEMPAPRAGVAAPMPRAPGRTAAEQLENARRRVADRQRRVRGRTVPSFVRGPRSYSNKPNAGVMGAIGLVLLVLGGVFYQSAAKKNATTVASAPAGFDIAVDGMGAGGTAFVEAPEFGPDAAMGIESFDQREAVVSSPLEHVAAVRDEIAKGLRSAHLSMGASGVDAPPAPAAPVSPRGPASIATPRPGQSRAEATGEQWLNESLQRTKQILDQRHPDGKVTVGSLASAAWQAFTSESRPGATTTPALTNPALANPALPGVAATSTPPQAFDPSIACEGLERVLMVSFVGVGATGPAADRERVLAERFERGAFCVLGPGGSPEETELLAQAKKEIGISTPGDDDARARLRAWLDGQKDLTAVMWVPADGRFNPVLVLKPSMPEDVKRAVRDAVTGR